MTGNVLVEIHAFQPTRCRKIQEISRLRCGKIQRFCDREETAENQFSLPEGDEGGKTKCRKPSFHLRICLSDTLELVLHQSKSRNVSWWRCGHYSLHQWSTHKCVDRCATVFGGFCEHNTTWPSVNGNVVFNQCLSARG